MAVGAFLLWQPAEEDASQPTQPATTTDEVTEPEPTTTVTEEVIGSSVQGREIRAYTYGDGDTRLLFVGAIHGGYEWNTVILMRRLMSYLEENPDELPDNITLTIIPILNPDGVFEVMGTTGPFTVADAPPTSQTTGGRFNANNVDLNRNFDCNWQPTSQWRGQTVDAGTSAFSEPEARVLRDYVYRIQPTAGILFHSAANGVYGSYCNDGILPETRAIMNTYAQASGYPAIESFDYYEITGDAEGWLAKVGIPSVSVELRTHETVEWEENLAGIKALFEYYSSEE